MADGEKAAAAENKTNGAATPLVIHLRKNVIANGDEVSSLSFREPTGGDIERVGNPVILDFLSIANATEAPKMTYDTRVMSAMMATLAGVPPSTIRALHPRDWNTIALGLAPFFMPEM